MSKPYDHTAPLSIPRAIGIAVGVFAAYSIALQLLISLLTVAVGLIAFAAFEADAVSLQSLLGTGSALISTIAMLLLLWWYSSRHAVHYTKNAAISQIKYWLKPRRLLAIVLVTCGLMALMTLFEKGLAQLFPTLFAQLATMMEMVGDMGLLYSVLYVCIVGPIAEELVYRGIGQHALQRSSLPIAATIVIQAVLFALMHLIPYQVMYTFFMGLILGYICYKTRSIIPGIIIHIINNTTSMIFQAFEISAAQELVVIVIWAILGIAGLILLARKTLSLQPSPPEMDPAQAVIPGFSPMQSGYAQAGYVQAVAPGFATAQAGYAQPVAPGFSPMQSGYAQAGYVQAVAPGFAQPSTPMQAVAPGFEQPSAPAPTAYPGFTQTEGAYPAQMPNAAPAQTVGKTADPAFAQTEYPQQTTVAPDQKEEAPQPEEPLWQ